MNFDPSNLPDDVVELKGMLASLASTYTDLEQKSQEKIHYLEEQIRLLKNELFGSKSEKLTKEDRLQLRLFNEAEDALETDAEAVPDDVPVKPHSRRKHGRRPLPEDLPRIDVVHDLSEDEKQCACGARLSKIGEEVSEKLDIVPAKIQVIRNIRCKYACKTCEGVDLGFGVVGSKIGVTGRHARLRTAEGDSACTYNFNENFLDYSTARIDFGADISNLFRILLTSG